MSLYDLVNAIPDWAFLMLIFGGAIVAIIMGRLSLQTCPFCAERIKKKAIICRYCGKNVAPGFVPNVAPGFVPKEIDDVERQKLHL